MQHFLLKVGSWPLRKIKRVVQKESWSLQGSTASHDQPLLL